jgi:pyruvate dehydrogenase E2 component (dihydrolipoamide acetyltransferase)
MAEIIEMPKMSDTMVEGLVVAWHKNVGDKVAAGDLLAEVETDKATMELESYFDGVLLYRAVEAGKAVTVGDLLAIIGTAGEDVAAIISSRKGAAAAPPALPSQAAEVVPAPAVTIPDSAPSVSPPPSFSIPEDEKSTRLKASPLAKAMAKEAGVELSQLAGTGDGGRIVKRDVEAAMSRTTVAAPVPSVPPPVSIPAPVAVGAYTDIPASQMRKTIARRLSESKFSAPHFYLTIVVEMDAAAEFREAVNADSDVKISFNDLIVKAAAVALRKHPQVNASWMGDFIRQYSYVNVGVAVAMDEGLIVPVIRDADRKGLTEIAVETRALAERARKKELQPHEFQGNTFTISNLGMFGIEEFTAIVNPPDACILAVGAIVKEAVVDENDTIRVARRMRLTLSCDHRAVDGATGSKFLQTLKACLEKPMRMLL